MISARGRTTWFTAEIPRWPVPPARRLARDILASGGNGVLYPSARYEGGRCLAALRPNLVQNIREGESWVFRWAGSAEVEISRVEVS